MSGGMLKAVTLAALIAASPMVAQGESAPAVPDAPAMPEAPAVPAADSEPADTPPVLRLKPTYKPKKRPGLPALETSEVASTKAEKSARDLAKRINASEASTAELVRLALDFGERKREAIQRAHDSLPGLIDVLNTACRALHSDDELVVIDTMQDLVLEAARLRESTLTERKSESDRESPFTALVESTPASAEVVRAQLQLVRKRFESHGDPWAVSTATRALDRAMDGGAKLALTPEEYFRYLEARGVLRPRDFEIVTTTFFKERFDAIKLADDVREKAAAILADKELIPELRLERLFRLLGETHEDELRDALAAARKAQSDALKAAEAERKLKAAAAERQPKAAERARERKAAASKPAPPPAK